MSSESKTVIENKKKWEIYIDVMMIIGKYFESNNDFINVMKVCKKFNKIVKIYHFNPISDCSLFENMETQYLYNIYDEKREGVASIGYECFYECSSLTNIELPSTLMSIGEKAFSNTNISTITIPEGVTSIGIYCLEVVHH